MGHMKGDFLPQERPGTVEKHRLAADLGDDDRLSTFHYPTGNTSPKR